MNVYELGFGAGRQIPARCGLGFAVLRSLIKESFMKLNDTPFKMVLLVVAFAASNLSFAATQSSAQNPNTAQNKQLTLKQMKSEVQSACQSDLKKYCSDVTPGQGRLASCLDSREDKLSKDCKDTWRSAKANISQRVDKAEVAMRKSCGNDIDKYCSNVPSGKGRILDCLSDHKDSLSDSCTRFSAQLEQRLAEVIG
jgi:hypothetical protein